MHLRRSREQIRHLRERLQHESRWPLYRVTGLYTLFSVLWVLLSDRIIEWLPFTQDRITLFQSYKGVAFVIASAFIIYGLTNRELRKREDQWRSYDRNLHETMDNLMLKAIELEQAYDATIEGWARALELRSREVNEHSRRVTDLSMQLGEAMGLSDDELKHLKRGSLLHDIGKMSIPDRVLLKEGPLAPDERQLIEQHPRLGYDMLAPIDFLLPALDVPRYHHEKWDGTGYPYGMRGKEIPRLARIFTVIDVWDALTSDRTYRSAIAEQTAREYIRSESGRSFDPEVVEAFLNLDLNTSATPGVSPES